jgi:hypothetical protein
MNLLGGNAVQFDLAAFNFKKTGLAGVDVMVRMLDRGSCRKQREAEVAHAGLLERLQAAATT